MGGQGLIEMRRLGCRDVSGRKIIICGEVREGRRERDGWTRSGMAKISYGQRGEEGAEREKRKGMGRDREGSD